MALGRKKLGDLLREEGLIDEVQLIAALGHQKQWGGRLGSTLVQMGFVTEEQIVEALSRQLGLPVVHLVGSEIPASCLESVPRELCEKYLLLPFDRTRSPNGSETIHLAMADPTNLSLVDEIAFKTGKRVSVAVAAERDVELAIRHHFYGESYEEQRRESRTLENATFPGAIFEFQDGDGEPIEVADEARERILGLRNQPVVELTEADLVPEESPLWEGRGSGWTVTPVAPLAAPGGGQPSVGTPGPAVPAVGAGSAGPARPIAWGAPAPVAVTPGPVGTGSAGPAQPAPAAPTLFRLTSGVAVPAPGAPIAPTPAAAIPVGGAGPAGPAQPTFAVAPAVPMEPPVLGILPAHEPSGVFPLPGAAGTPGPALAGAARPAPAPAPVAPAGPGSGDGAGPATDRSGRLAAMLEAELATAGVPDRELLLALTRLLLRKGVLLRDEWIAELSRR